MDGYLDQQVPYTLANVRMDELPCFSPPVGGFGRAGFSVSPSLHEFCAEAFARDAKLVFEPLKTNTEISRN